MTPPRIRSKRTILATATAATLVALLFVSEPYAQKDRRKEKGDGTVARLAELQGNVLVSRDDGLVSGNEAQRLLPGTRIITTASSNVVVEYDDGCRVTMKENQRFEVEEDRDCTLLAALPIIDAPAALGIPFASLLIPGAVGGAGVGAIIDSRGTQTVSPS